VSSDTPEPVEERVQRWNVQLTREEWNDLLLMLQCLAMPGVRYQRIIDSLQIQTRRIRDERG
jgi:hypothetical protein